MFALKVAGSNSRPGITGPLRITHDHRHMYIKLLAWLARNYRAVLQCPLNMAYESPQTNGL